jgi:hypothetical protein
MNATEPELRGKDRWASVAKDADRHTAQTRHIVAKGHPTSVCGTTALPVTTWRGNKTKPACPTCVARYAKEIR